MATPLDVHLERNASITLDGLHIRCKSAYGNLEIVRTDGRQIDPTEPVFTFPGQTRRKWGRSVEDHKR